jgi:hypothetical protein
MLGVINRQVISALGAQGGNARRKRLAMAAMALLALGGLPAFPVPAFAGDTLSDKGVRLTAVSVSPGAQDIRRSVDLGGDQPIASYVTARSPAGAMLMRTRQGYWLPWSGRSEELIDTGVTATGGTLEFKILKEELAAAHLPITVSIGYRTAAGLSKFGTFDITAK